MGGFWQKFSLGQSMCWLTMPDWLSCWWRGPSLRLPHSRAFGDGLFELRPRGRSGIGRAFFCFLIGQRVVVLHAFIKKSQQTPDTELKLARKRLKEVQHG